MVLLPGLRVNEEGHVHHNGELPEHHKGLPQLNDARADDRVAQVPAHTSCNTHPPQPGAGNELFAAISNCAENSHEEVRPHAPDGGAHVNTDLLDGLDLAIRERRGAHGNDAEELRRVVSRGSSSRQPVAALHRVAQCHSTTRTREEECTAVPTLYADDPTMQEGPSSPGGWPSVRMASSVLRTCMGKEGTVR